MISKPAAPAYFVLRNSYLIQHPTRVITSGSHDRTSNTVHRTPYTVHRTPHIVHRTSNTLLVFSLQRVISKNHEAYCDGCKDGDDDDPRQVNILAGICTYLLNGFINQKSNRCGTNQHPHNTQYSF